MSSTRTIPQMSKSTEPTLNQYAGNQTTMIQGLHLEPL